MKKLAPERSLYKRSFSPFGIQFDDRPKVLYYRQISPKMVLLANCPTKNKSQSVIEYLVRFSEGSDL